MPRLPLHGSPQALLPSFPCTKKSDGHVKAQSEGERERGESESERERERGEKESERKRERGVCEREMEPDIQADVTCYKNCLAAVSGFSVLAGPQWRLPARHRAAFDCLHL